jgi:hypothetical protein
LKKTFLVAAIVSILAFPSLGFAASSISGTVVDEESGDPVQGWVDVHKWNEGEEWWEWAGYIDLDENGEFIFDSLKAGTYILSSNGYNHVPEFYDDVPLWDWENKTEIELDKNEDLVLNLIELKLRPFYFGNVWIEPDPVPKKGGDVTLYAEIINTTNEKVQMKLWVMGNIKREDESDYYGTSSTFPLTKKPSKVKLKPGVNLIEIQFKISKKYPAGWQHVNVFGGKSYEEPMVEYGYVGFFKEGKTSVNTPSVERERKIPRTLSKDGKVIE